MLTNVIKCQVKECDQKVATNRFTSYCNKCYKALFQAPVIFKKENKNHITRRKYELKTKYSLSLEEYNKLFKSQNFQCYICKAGNKTSKNFPVDHCYKTGKIRGILCNPCNKALGLLKDSQDSLLRAVEYLKKHQVK